MGSCCPRTHTHTHTFSFLPSPLSRLSGKKAERGPSSPPPSPTASPSYDALFHNEEEEWATLADGALLSY